jgi:hypothetical protein
VLHGARIITNVEGEGVVSEVFCNWEGDGEQGEAMGEHLIEDGGGVLSNDDAGITGIGEIGTETDRSGGGENGTAQSVGYGGRRIVKSKLPR